MGKLKNQGLAEVHNSIAVKDYGTAVAILEQLKQVVPSDLDVAEITLQTRVLYMEQ